MSDYKHTFTVKRSRWMRGGSVGKLLDKYQRQCCLGFYLRSIGCRDSVLLDTGMPSSVRTGLPDEAQWLLQRSRAWGRAEKALVTLNDEGDLDDTEREQKIAEEFAKHGIQVIFED